MLNYLKAVAFYLPQYHPVPENDDWWGKGFTEWTNVAKARPLFPGHYQPHLPADLGFYDLRLAEVRQAQADLARQYGVHGFCYYHYWFNERRILERPFNEVLASGHPGFPFCLCWANENWTRRWDGFDKEVLLEQQYAPEDDVAHINSLFSAFVDERYIKVDGKPLFIIYRLNELPDPQRTIDIWREEAHRFGLPGLFLCNVEAMDGDSGIPNGVSMDASIEFAPDWSCLPPRVGCGRWNGIKQRIRNFGKRYSGYVDHRVGDYKEFVNNMLRKPTPNYLRFPGVTPGWDNTARRKKGGMVLKDSSPEIYRSWLEAVVLKSQDLPKESRFIFVNAWNEWAEGNHLEPCQKWGRAYLEATKQALAISNLDNDRSSL